MSVDHYENFPVASWLCPAAIRPAVRAVYGYARTADDLADEGDVDPVQRRQDLAQYRAELERCLRGDLPDTRWATVFEALGRAHQAHALPAQALRDLLSAFEQDVANPLHADRASLLRYCTLSANPVGRIMLHLAGVTDLLALTQSDRICTALQLINFWQDLGADLARGRCYLPLEDARRHDLDLQPPWHDDPALRGLLVELCDWTEGVMHAGAPLVHRVPGRLGWELRLVVQGGLRILERIRAMQYATLTHRPTLNRSDAPRLLWRAVRMSATVKA